MDQKQRELKSFTISLSIYRLLVGFEMNKREKGKVLKGGEGIFNDIYERWILQTQMIMEANFWPCALFLHYVLHLFDHILSTKLLFFFLLSFPFVFILVKGVFLKSPGLL